MDWTSLTWICGNVMELLKSIGTIYLDGAVQWLGLSNQPDLRHGDFHSGSTYKYFASVVCLGCNLNLRDVGRPSHMYRSPTESLEALASGTGDTYSDNLKSTTDGPLQQWFREGLAGKEHRFSLIFILVHSCIYLLVYCECMKDTCMFSYA